MPSNQLVGDVVVVAGTSLAFTDESAFLGTSGDGPIGPPSLTIAGSVVVDAPNAPAGSKIGLLIGNAPGGVEIATTGSVNVTSSGAAYGYSADYARNFSNDGTLFVTGQSATGVEATNTGGGLLNSGTMHIVATNGAAAGAILASSIDIENSGRIEVEGTGATSSVGISGGILTVGSFNNSGTITVSSNLDAPSVAAALTMGVGSRFSNSGLLQGDYALKVVGTLFSSTFENLGAMRGIVELGSASGRFSNDGSIVGDVNLGGGDDFFVNRGSVVGLVSGGAGNDTLQGGSQFDYLQGNAGNDSIDGGPGGNDWLVGGQGDDRIAAHSGQNVLYGNLGADTLQAGSGGDLLRGGQGNDSIVGGPANDWISGDRGDDTLSGGAGADTFHTFNGAGLDRVLDFHAAEGDRVQLDPGTIYSVSQVGGDVVIDLGSGDQMVLVNTQLSTLPAGWIFGA